MDNVGGINFSFPNPFQKRFDIKYAIPKGIAGNDNWTGNFIQGVDYDTGANSPRKQLLRPFPGRCWSTSGEKHRKLPGLRWQT